MAGVWDGWRVGGGVRGQRSDDHAAERVWVSLRATARDGDGNSRCTMVGDRPNRDAAHGRGQERQFGGSQATRTITSRLVKSLELVLAGGQRGKGILAIMCGKSLPAMNETMRPHWTSHKQGTTRQRRQGSRQLTY